MGNELLGKRIRETRIKKKYTQQRLAEEAGIGQMYLGEIERGVKMPSLRIFVRIVETLEVSADYILKDELSSGAHYVYDEVCEKLNRLSPKQRKTASDILDAYIRNI